MDADTNTIIVNNWDVIKPLYEAGYSHNQVHAHLKSIGNPVGNMPVTTYRTKYNVVASLMEYNAKVISDLTGQMDTLANQLEQANNTIHTLDADLAAAKSLISDLTEQLNTRDNAVAELSNRIELSDLVINSVAQGYENAMANVTAKIDNIPKDLTGGSVGVKNPIDSNIPLAGLTPEMRAEVQAMINASVGNISTNNSDTNVTNNSDNNDFISKPNYTNISKPLVTNNISRPNNANNISKPTRTKNVSKPKRTNISKPILQDSTRQDGVPKKFMDWNVGMVGGYYQLYKRMNGKQVGLHLSRVWDEDKAKAKIAEYEAKNPSVAKQTSEVQSLPL